MFRSVRPPRSVLRLGAPSPPFSPARRPGSGASLRCAPPSLIYKPARRHHSAGPGGETHIPPASQLGAEERQNTWVIDPPNQIKRSPRRNRPRPPVRTRKRSRLWPPSKSPPSNGSPAPLPPWLQQPARRFLLPTTDQTLIPDSPPWRFQGWVTQCRTQRLSFHPLRFALAPCPFQPVRISIKRAHPIQNRFHPVGTLSSALPSVR